MAGTPDISSVINLIMQNPTLISEISELVKTAEATKESEVTDAPTEEPKDKTEAAPAVTVSAPINDGYKRANRRELLNAMKPYLSESRRGALDSMSSILDILDVMTKKQG